jgi:hypothetical protein
MNRLQRALEAQGLAQLLQRQVILLVEQRAHLATMGGQDHGFAAGKVVPRSDVTRTPTLLQELLNHPERDAKTMGDLSPGALVVIVSVEDPLTEIQRKRAHVQRLAQLPRHGYIIY